MTTLYEDDFILVARNDLENTIVITNKHPKGAKIEIEVSYDGFYVTCPKGTLIPTSRHCESAIHAVPGRAKVGE